MIQAQTSYEGVDLRGLGSPARTLAQALQDLETKASRSSRPAVVAFIQRQIADARSFQLSR